MQSLSDILTGGVGIEQSEMLEGCKKAVLMGDVLYVSPAMWRLMDGATSDELEHLFKNLRVLVMPPPAVDLAPANLSYSVLSWVPKNQSP